MEVVDHEKEDVVRPSSGILRPNSARRTKGQEMRLQVELRVDPAYENAYRNAQGYPMAPNGTSPAMSYSSVNSRQTVSTVATSEFKLQWPKQQHMPVGVSQLIPIRAKTNADELQSRMSKLSQPQNRTPRLWQKMQQREETEPYFDEAETPRSAQPSSARPGWLSARRSLSDGNNIPRVQSARARRPPEWTPGAGSLGNTAGSGMSTMPAALANVKLESVEEVQKEQILQSKKEMREFRDKLFENPKRRFSKKEMEHFCQKLLGNNDVQTMQRICSRAPDDRSYEDCKFLCKMLSKSSFLQENLSMPRMLCAARCVQTLALAPGEDLLVKETTPQVFILIQGLMAEPISGDLIKQGDHILRMPDLPKRANAFNQLSLGYKWKASAHKASGARRKPSRQNSSVFDLVPETHQGKAAGSIGSSPATSPRSTPRTAPVSPSMVLFMHAHGSPETTPSSSAMPTPDVSPTLTHSEPSKRKSIVPPLLCEEGEEAEQTSEFPRRDSVFSRGSSGSSEPSFNIIQHAGLPSSYSALQQCYLLAFNVNHFTALADSLETDIKTGIWLCISSDGQQARDWRKVTLLIQTGIMLIVCPTEGLLHRITLASCSGTDKVHSEQAESWEHLRMRIQGFEPKAAFYVRHLENTQLKTILLTAFDTLECDAYLQAIKFYSHIRSILGTSLQSDPPPQLATTTPRYVLSRAESASRTDAVTKMNNVSRDLKMIQEIVNVHTRLLHSRIAEVSDYIMSLKPFQTWSLKEMHQLMRGVRTLVHYRGQVVFEQGTPVKGFYMLRHGTVRMQHLQSVQEAELRFPGREDLMMEEDLEFKIKDFVRKVPLGTCKEAATFGEELVGTLPIKGYKDVPAGREPPSPNVSHAYTLTAESTVVLFMIPWQAYQERLEDKKTASAMRTLELFGHNKRNRADYIQTRRRYYRGSRFFVDLAKYKHLNPRGYLKAAQLFQRFMDLYSAIIDNSEPGQQVQHCDVQEAEAAANKSAESLDCISRATRTPAQKKELKRLIDSMVEEMREMLQEVRGIFQEQMRAKLHEGTSAVDAQLLSSNTNHAPSPDHEDEL